MCEGRIHYVIQPSPFEQSSVARSVLLNDLLLSEVKSLSGLVTITKLFCVLSESWRTQGLFVLKYRIDLFIQNTNQFTSSEKIWRKLRHTTLLKQNKSDKVVRRTHTLAESYSTWQYSARAKSQKSADYITEELQTRSGGQTRLRRY